MEAANADRQSGRKERTREVDGAWKLVGLHADKPDQRLAARVADLTDDPLGLGPPVGLVIGMQPDSTSGPSTFRRCASSAKPFRHANVLEGMADRYHRMG